MTELENGFDHINEIKVLFDEYTQMLVSLDPSFQLYLDIQHYSEEVDNLRAKYSPPDGRLYHLRVDSESAGCVALRKLDEDRCELKRLYVRPVFRGRGLSRLLIERILSDASSIGYRTILLDTLPELESAVNLYLKYGFEYTGCYNDSPVDKTIFMKKEL